MIVYGKNNKELQSTVPYGPEPDNYITIAEEEDESLPWSYFLPVHYEYSGRFGVRKRVIIKFIRYVRLALNMNMATWKDRGWYFREDLVEAEFGGTL